MYYVYILYSISTGRFYKGQTSNLEVRLKRHNSGSEKYTCKGTPWKLVFSIKKNSRSEALILEKKLKHLSRQRTINFMLKYNEGFAGSDELFWTKQLSEC
jgi:putative endonuclease